MNRTMKNTKYQCPLGSAPRLEEAGSTREARKMKTGRQPQNRIEDGPGKSEATPARSTRSERGAHNAHNAHNGTNNNTDSGAGGER